MLAPLALSLLVAGPLLELPAAAPAALRVYLVRHGEAYSNLRPPPDLAPEQLDRLTELGHEQARRAALELRGRGVAAVLSSPAFRARETAAGIGTLLGLGDVTVEPRLRPMEAGRHVSGRALTWDERRAEWKAGRDPSFAEGDSIEEVARRVEALVLDLRRAHPRGAVVLVAHSEVIGAFVGLLDGVTPAARYPWNLANGSVTVVDVEGAAARVVLRNHLPAEAPAPR